MSLPPAHRRAVIYQHEAHEGPGLIAPALEAAGFQLVQRFRDADHADVEAGLLVVLGGGMAVYESQEHPFLAHELAVISERLANGRPCLGVCLGSQLMAQAAGGEVFPGKNGFEVGVAPVRWTQEGLVDPVLAGVKPKSLVAHWHGDTFRAVPNATLLASTDRYAQQAFRIGDSYAFQFHLELTGDELGRWYDVAGAHLPEKAPDLETLRAQLPKLRGNEAELRGICQRLAEHFAQAASRHA